jgi:hypothetical protein
MLDHEYLSELAIAYLHGPQNKKDRLDYYYQLYEERFEDREHLIKTFRKVTAEIDQLIVRLAATRWKKKSDFYTLFLALAPLEHEFPWSAGRRTEISERLADFGARVDSLLGLEEDEWGTQDENVVTYARNVARAASDRANRVARAKAFSRFVFHEADGCAQPGPHL